MPGQKTLTPQERAKREAKRRRKFARLEVEARQALAEILKQDCKRRHHTIWRKYMEAWADSKGTVWCRQNGKTHPTGTGNLGVQKDFYRLKEITDETLAGIEKLVINPMPDPRDRKIALGWIPKFREVFVLRDMLQRAGVSDADIEKAIELKICNTEEDMHADAEGAALDLLHTLREGDAKLLSDDSTYVDFSRFIALQYMRTPGIAAKAIATLRDMPGGFDGIAAWGLIRTIWATTISKGIYLSRNQTRLRFLETDSSVEFVTGDQPVINLGHTESLELYYPLTPKRALLLTPGEGTATIDSQTITDDKVRGYNCLIRDAAHQQLYGTSKSALEQLFV